jgi:hypothetical protein
LWITKEECFISKLLTNLTKIILIKTQLKKIKEINNETYKRILAIHKKKR